MLSHEVSHLIIVFTHIYSLKNLVTWMS